MRVVLVYKSGGEYKDEHVYRLRDQIMAHNPTFEVVCITDALLVGIDTISMLYDFPGWWSKMEMFRPDIEGDFLYMDLDTTVVGKIPACDDLLVMRDVYRPKGLQSSLMFIPSEYRPHVWRRWIKYPSSWMEQHRQGGDQAFLERWWVGMTDRWQDVFPGLLKSYKADNVAKLGPQGASIIIHHGKPRPWEVE